MLMYKKKHAKHLELQNGMCDALMTLAAGTDVWPRRIVDVLY